ncbi:MAG: PASTA domain-containing protein, partial [Gammaproteobacteria bacterium]
MAFSAVVSPAGAQPPIILNGVRQQLPVFPWWAPPAAVALLALVIALAALLRPGAPTVPVIPQVDEAAAVKLLEEEQYQPEPVKAGDDTVAEGLAIRTDPAGGAELQRGERVKLFISTGKCPDGPCPVEVPNVVGKPVEEATALLEGLKFTVRTDRVPSDERPVDHVIASDPAATTSRPVGSDVTLTVSTGPPEQNNPSANPGGAVPLPGPAGDKPAEDKPAEDKPAEEKPPPPGEKPPAEEKPPAGDKPAPPASVELPDLTARSGDDATKALADLGLKAKTVTQHTNAIPDGQVLSTKPDAKSKVEPGSDVTLTVAQNTARVDLIATAAKATWTNGTGNTLDFPGTDADQTGLVRQRTVEGAKLLETNPHDTGAITGEYKLAKPAVPGDHIRARVRLLPNTTGATGATAGEVT